MKKIILFGIIVVLMAIMSFGVSGATCATTCDNAEASKGVPLVCNMTLTSTGGDGIGGDFNATNATLYISSSSTANSTALTHIIATEG